MPDPKALVISLAPFAFATRSRKAAVQLARDADTTFLALSKVGRNKNWDKAGIWTTDNIRIVQVSVATPRTAPTKINQIRNILLVYLPGLVRLVRQAVRTPATLVFVNGTSLLAVGLVHRLVHRSSLVLDINERPGMVAARGSVASLYARLESRLLRMTSRFVTAACVVTRADVDIARDLGFRTVHLVRNVPLAAWPAPWVEPPFSRGEGQELKALMMGSIFEGRGYETLIRAVALANRNLPVSLVLCGPSRDEYRESLKLLARSEGVQDQVSFIDRVDPAEVSAGYLRADVGLVLYESDDPGNDGLSNKLFECICSGRPVIASDLPENRHFVASNEVGWLTRTEPHAIAQTLEIVARSGLLPTVAERCRDFSRSNLNWEREFFPVARLVDPQEHSGES